MKTFFKWFFITFSLFLLLLFIVAGLLSDKYIVERSIKINAPQDSVFAFVANLNTWRNWNPWFLADSTIKSQIRVTEDIKNSFWKWESKRLGSGKLTIKEVFPPDSIYADMEFSSPSKTLVKEYWKFTTVNDSTLVCWIHIGPLDYPLGRIFGLWSDSMLGPTFEEGLKLLKTELEKK